MLAFVVDVEVVPKLKGAALAIVPWALVTVVVLLDRLAMELDPLIPLGEPPKENPAEAKGLVVGEVEFVDVVVLIDNIPGVDVDAGVELSKALELVTERGVVDPRVTDVALVASGDTAAIDAEAVDETVEELVVSGR